MNEPIRPGENVPHSERAWNFGPADYVLGLLTLPLLLFMLMFVTSRISESLHDPGYRLRLLLGMLALEVVFVGVVVWLVLA